MKSEYFDRDDDVSRDLTLLTQPPDLPEGARARFEDELSTRPGSREAYNDARSRRMLVKTLSFFRRSLGVSQTDVAHMMDTSQSAISDIEKGLKDPRLSTLQRFARALGLELHISVSVGYWLAVYAWHHRSFAYTSSVRVTRIAEGLEDQWGEVLRGTDQRAAERADRIAGQRIRPLAMRNTADDNYLSKKDVLRMELSRSVLMDESS